MKFEYLDVAEVVDAGRQQEALNKYGADGWELVYYNPDTRVFHSKATMHAVFKRLVLLPPSQPVGQKAQSPIGRGENARVRK